MKRISSLILAAAFVFGSMGAAQAIDTKVKGTWDFTFGWGVHEGFQNNAKALNTGSEKNKDYFHARQGVATQINFIASENLQAVLQLYIGDLDWGKDKNKIGDGAGAGIDTDGINIKTRLAYLDWLIPDTGIAVRMGLQDIALPMATGYNNPIFNARSAGISTSYMFDDTFAVTAFWARPFYDNTVVPAGSSNKTDMFGLIAPITLDGVTLTPWGSVARVGNNSNAFGYMEYNGLPTTNGKVATSLEDTTTTAWWAGLGINVDLLDPLTFALDAMYGRVGKTAVAIATAENTGDTAASGWFLASTLNYKLDWATPGLFGWWSTGDTEKKLNADKYGRMPVLGTDGGFNPLVFGVGGNLSLGQDNILTKSAQGTWGIGAQLADMSFIEDLTHTIRVAYITGTNSHKIVKGADDKGVIENLRLHEDKVYLTNKDHAFEVDLTNTYQIYENLAATVELGYVKLKLNKNTWGSDYVKNYKNDAWKAQVNLKYDF